jgi:glutamate/tyrosine decarboxylase-like PLP-dependent enzyme
VLVALKATGRERLEAMVDHVLALAQYAAEAIDDHPHFELVAHPQTVMVAFRHTAADNIAIHRDLFDSGQAVIGRTTVDGRPVLKLTLLNPNTTRADVDALLELISAAGARAA